VLAIIVLKESLGDLLYHFFLLYSPMFLSIMH